MKNNIKSIRMRKGISQEELAEKAGISVWWLNHIENGKRNPGIKSLARIAKVLDVSIKDIFLK